MRNEPNFQKAKKVVRQVLTTNYNEKWTLDTWSKRTQTKPILSRAQSRDLSKQLFASGGKEFRPEHFSDFSIFPQHIQQVLHILRQGGFEFYRLFSRWVLEFQGPGVQGASAYNRLFNSRSCIPSASLRTGF